METTRTSYANQQLETSNQLPVVAVFPFLTGMEAHMVDALTPQSDEGRGLAAKCFGEVPGNL